MSVMLIELIAYVVVISAIGFSIDTFEAKVYPPYKKKKEEREKQKRDRMRMRLAVRTIEMERGL